MEWEAECRGEWEKIIKALGIADTLFFECGKEFTVMGPLFAAAFATKPKVRVEIENEVATSEKPARVLVYDDEDKLIAEIVASRVREQGADGGSYVCVKLEKKEISYNI